ncbi:hypothetical protein R83H12_03001 [Fibrobacteria bacterium R8-3-H12]
MIRENFPENPQERKVIVLLDAVDIVSVFKSSWINSPNITALEYPFDSDSPILESELYKSLEMQNLIEQGAILSQSPYDFGDYRDSRDIESLISSNALQKYTIFSGFCRKLGATRIYGKHIESETNDTNREVGGKAGYKIAEAEFKMNKDLERKLSQELELEDTYDGDPNPDIEEAKKYLFANHVSHDKVFTSLLEGRTGSGKIRSRNLSFSLTSESMQSLKILGGIKFGLFNADGNFENKVHTLKNLKVSLSIEFGKG